MPLLEAVGLTRRTAERTLLDDIALRVDTGDRVAVLGPTGSGKTLLLRSLAQLDPIDSGEIRWQGRPQPGNDIPAFRSRVLYLAQRPAFAEGTVEDNLRQPFSFRVHRDRSFDRSWVLEHLHALGRDESFLSKDQRQLSGGEAQLTALLRAIQLDPALLLLDEPTAALDADSTRLVEQTIARWLDGRPARATMWVTHDADQARRACTSTLTIRAGRLTKVGDAEIR